MWIYLACSLILIGTMGYFPLNAEEGEWVETCRIAELPIWEEAQKEILIYYASTSPEVLQLSREIRTILKEYRELKRGVPGVESECLAVIKEGVAINELINELQNEGNRYNADCYNRPRDTKCAQWYFSLLKQKEALVERQNNHKKQETTYYSNLFNYEKTLDDLITRLQTKLPLACTKERENLEKELIEKREQIKAVQEALRRLDKSIQLDGRELKKWKKTTEEASQAAWEQGRQMLLNNLGDVVGILSGDADKWGGKDAVEVLETQLKDPELKKIVADLKSAEKAVSDLHWTSESLEPTLENAYSELADALGNPKVQKMLMIGGQYATYASYLKSIVDSSYNIVAEICAWRRITQLDRNSEKYLEAVNKLDEQMKKKVAEVNSIKRQLAKLQCE
jgi:hypothetical protein